MKKIDFKKAGVLKRWSYRHLLAPLRRVFKITNEDSAADFRVPLNELPNPFLPYDENQRMNAQLLEMEIQKAESLKSTRERSRLT